jgi:GDP/UDP-N,N'-diacetylbacillosamine 2-epimerase (hydrolysing)
MKVGVLTSSRADYSIYFPLLKQLRDDPFFDLEIIAFGTHLSPGHGSTVEKIVSDGFEVKHRLHTLPASDSPQAIAEAMGKTQIEFSALWAGHGFDLVFCLGDRYEMFAACASAVPFNLKLAHIHGGEETAGAIDNVFRHAITVMASVHFTAAEPYRQRVIQLLNADAQVYNVGSLSIDNLQNLNLYDVEEFKSRFGIDLAIPSILITFHPETVSFQKNDLFVNELIKALDAIKDYQFIITMPNNDTMGNLIRERLNSFIGNNPRAFGIESLGTIGYLSCMKYASFLLGNTSSGFIEASFFPKFVINLGDRQKGRIVTPNIRNCPIDADAIISAVHEIEKLEVPPPVTLYGKGDASARIKAILKNYL